ncbi:IS4 family transposase, partial [Haladaptatus sp. NG-WS-4]
VLIEDQQSGNTDDTNGKDEPISLENEHEKWVHGDREATEWLPEGVRPIFIHDRGADAFSLYTELTEEMDNTGFVVRANQNRRIHTDDGEGDKRFDWSDDLPEEGRTTIQIHHGGGRQAREAKLSIRTGTCDLLPPQNDSAGKNPVTVNVVRIDEISESDDPIQWVLLTTESVEDFDDAVTIIEYYRARWRIEDWQKVLKTGCEIEERQLQTWERMEVLLSVYSVIAWKVLE